MYHIRNYKLEKREHAGVLISVNRREQSEIVNIARKLDNMGKKEKADV